MTNNEAEHEALIYGLELALKLGVQNLKVLLDSELVSGQVNKTFGTKDQRMKLYCSKVVQLMRSFRRIDIQVIKRELNVRADQLAKGAAYGEYDKKSKLTTVDDHPPNVNMVEAIEDLRFNLTENSWMDPIIDYLKNGKEPGDKNQARKLRIKDARYAILEGGLYKK